MKLHVRNKNNFICGRAGISAAISADVGKKEGFKVVHDKWAEVFKNEAKLIVGEQYDFRKIKGKKDLEQFYNWMVDLEVAKAMVYAHRKFKPDVMKKVRTDVDELTARLGMAPSTLGWIYNHPEDKPKDEGKKKKQKIGYKLMSHYDRCLKDIFEFCEKDDWHKKFNNLALDKVRTDRDNAEDLGNAKCTTHNTYIHLL